MSVGMYQEISYLRFLLKLVDILQFWLKSDRNNYVNTVEPGYSDFGLSDTSFITSDVLWFHTFLTANHNFIPLGYNDTRL
jgi:hypothetical protein